MARPDRSRAALLDSAALLFRRQGYAATTVHQIVESAGAKKGSLYHHFPGGKQELAAEVVDTVGGDVERQLRGLLESDLTVADIIDVWIDLMIMRLSADQRDGSPIEPIATESVNASPWLRDVTARAFARWRMAVSDRLCADSWSEPEAEQTALCSGRLARGRTRFVARCRRHGSSERREDGCAHTAPLCERR